MRQTSQTFTMDGGERTVAMSNFHYFPSWTHRPEWNSVHIRHRKVFRRFRASGSPWFSFLLCFLTLWSVSDGAVKTSSSSQQARCYVDDPQTGLIPDLSQIDAFTQQPNVYSIRACAKRCCRVPSCDLAFLGNGLCFLVDCSYSETVCQPQEGNEETYIALVTRNSTFGPLADTSSSSQHRNSRHKDSVKEKDDGSNGETTMQPKHESPDQKGQTTVKVPKKESQDETPENPEVEEKNVVTLHVSGGDSKVLQLPQEDHITLHTFVVPEDEGEYKYDWRLVSGPEESTANIIRNGEEMKVTDLQAGLYTFEINVTSPNGAGSARVNITVLSPPRENTPPVAVVYPKGNVEVVTSPVDEDLITGHESLLKLQHLSPGFYQFRLTVTDIDGATDVALVNVTVKEEVDLKPFADPGEEQVIHLPTDEVILNGNGSRDDHGIVKWEWTIVEGGLADMSGSSDVVLKASKLQQGIYTFRLKVYDSKGQSANNTVRVHVLSEEENKPPVADAGPHKELSLPDDSTTLDGSGSRDDVAIATYLWEMIKQVAV
ncbi:hypothetical protein BSL78_19799 [Apostichopus japonicus]|uniref:Seven cysteines N-terminal domain-containing protein n=1 Tax=Stichopus japonicus TaxID=307972 RepID=A0A2G8K5U3_STIJA|nr:hypothetical protein BSL78_19799 [Apostichopus japonicus]